MDRLEAMSILLMVVEKGSFSAAGRALQIPVSTLSRKISDLELLLGAPLLTRTTRRLMLTDAGLLYVAAARRILDDVDEAERLVAGEFMAPKGELVISAPVFFGRLHLLPIVADFLAVYPQINVRLALLDRNVHLVDDHVDMAVRIGSLPDSMMIATRIGAMRSVVCASPVLLAEYGIPQTADDLRTFPCIATDAPTPWLGWQFRAAGSTRSTDVRIVPRLTVSTAEAALDAAVRGIGVTRLLHYQVADAVKSGVLQIILEDYEPAPAPVHLVHVDRGQMPLKMRCFLDFAAPRLRELLRGIDSRAVLSDRPGR